MELKHAFLLTLYLVVSQKLQRRRQLFSLVRNSYSDHLIHCCFIHIPLGTQNVCIKSSKLNTCCPTSKRKPTPWTGRRENGESNKRINVNRTGWSRVLVASHSAMDSPWTSDTKLTWWRFVFFSRRDFSSLSWIIQQPYWPQPKSYRQFEQPLGSI